MGNEGETSLVSKGGTKTDEHSKRREAKEERVQAKSRQAYISKNEEKRRIEIRRGEPGNRKERKFTEERNKR